MVCIFVLILVGGGGFLAYMGVQEARLRSAPSEQPQVVSCEELSENGPGANAFVEMQDFILCDFAYVYEQKGESGQVFLSARTSGVRQAAKHRSICVDSPETITLYECDSKSVTSSLSC